MLHLGQGTHLVADGVDVGKSLQVKALFSREAGGVGVKFDRLLVVGEAYLAHKQVFFFEVSGGLTEIGVVGRDDEIVETVEAEHGHEGYLYENKTILAAMRPKILDCLIHLFWFSDSTIGFRSECQAGSRAAMRLSTAQHTKAMRKRVGVKNIRKSRLI